VEAAQRYGFKDSADEEDSDIQKHLGWEERAWAKKGPLEKGWERLFSQSSV
jgi:hypothetical protein